MLIDAGAYKDRVNNNGMTALKLAIKNSSYVTVKVLIECSVKISELDIEAARAQGVVQIVDLLRNAKNHVTELHSAAIYGDIQQVKKLIDDGADKNARDDSGCTPLHRAAERGYVEIVKILLAAGANKDANDNYGRTPLHHITGMQDATDKHVEIVRILIDAGANKDAQDNYGRTPLHSAAEQGNTECAKMLIDNGANKEAVDNYGVKPLYYAVKEGRSELVELLLAAGANKSKIVPNSYGTTLIEMALNYRKDDMPMLLVKCGVKVTEHDIQRARSLKLVQLAETLRGSQQSQLDDETTLGDKLHGAVSANNIAAVEKLINQGANKEITLWGKTALIVAVEKGFIEVAKLLIDAGANKDFKGPFGRTPLHVAVIEGNMRLVRILVDENVDKDRKDESGMTPLFGR
jgi:ankyrin repeat protein